MNTPAGASRPGGSARLDIRVSAQVAAALGPDATAQVQAVTTLAGGRCPICRQPLPPAGPATVLVARGGHAAHATYAHLDCAGLAVADVVDVDDQVLADAWPDELDMGVSALVLTHRQAPLPTLVAELTGSRAYRATAPVGPAGPLGELTDLLVSTLLGRGCALVTRLREAPRHAAGWHAYLGHADPAGRAALTILDPTGGIFYLGTTYPPTGFYELAARYGWLVLYAGTVELPGGDDGRAGLAALRAAAAAGGLVGARITVTVTDQHPAGQPAPGTPA